MSNIKKYNFDDFSAFCSFILPNKIAEYLKEKTGEKWVNSQSRVYDCEYYDSLDKNDLQSISNWKDLARKDNNIFFNSFKMSDSFDPPLLYSFSEHINQNQYQYQSYRIDEKETTAIPSPIESISILDVLENYNMSRSTVFSVDDGESILQKKYSFLPFGNVITIGKIVIKNIQNDKIDIFYRCNFDLIIRNPFDYDDTTKVYHFYMEKDIPKIEEAINKAQIDESSYINPQIFPEEAKNTEKRIFDIFKNQSNTLREKHLPVQLGIMISGLPGTGKSIFVKYLKDQVKPLFHSIYSYGINDLHNLCSHGQNLPNNALLVFDDIECVLKERTQDGDNATILSWLLSQFDNGDRTTNRLIILVTNHTEPIDDALKRPGRIDYHIEFNVPSTEDMINLLLFHTGKDLSNTKANNIVEYLKFEIPYATFANIALLCRLMYTDANKDIKKVSDWKSIIDFMKKTSAYEGKKEKLKDKKSRKIGFGS